MISGSSKAKETGEVDAAPAVHAPSGGKHFLRQSVPMPQSVPRPIALGERLTVAGAPDDSKIVMVLDASGSMNTVKADIVGSINGFLDAQKTITEDKPTFSLLQFGHVNHWRFVDVPLETIPAFEAHMYEVAGGTPLYDSIGAAIETFDRFNDLSLVIITDGEDNTSTLFTRDRIRNMIAKKKAEQNWEIIYLCADESGFAAGAAMGVSSNMNVPQSLFAANICNEMSFAVQAQRMTNNIKRLEKLHTEK
jgi:hypothetical protein